jgi:hypothetical protein
VAGELVQGWINRSDSSAARPTAISSRSANDKQRPFRLRPRRGCTSPAVASHRVPFFLYVPASSAASVVNSPRCIAAQNVCTISGTNPIRKRRHSAPLSHCRGHPNENHLVVTLSTHLPTFLGLNSHPRQGAPPGRSSSLRSGRSTWTHSSTTATGSQDRGRVISAVSLTVAVWQPLQKPKEASPGHQDGDDGAGDGSAGNPAPAAELCRYRREAPIRCSSVAGHGPGEAHDPHDTFTGVNLDLEKENPSFPLRTFSVQCSA